MRIELERYQSGVSTLKMIGAILLVFCYFCFILHQPLLIQVVFLLVAAALVILLYKKINSLAKIMGYYLLEFDEDFLYYTSSYKETKIPLQDITAIKLNGYMSNSAVVCYQYKIVYTDSSEVKEIRFTITPKTRDQLGELKRVTQIKNPELEIVTHYPN